MFQISIDKDFNFFLGERMTFQSINKLRHYVKLEHEHPSTNQCHSKQPNLSKQLLNLVKLLTNEQSENLKELQENKMRKINFSDPRPKLKLIIQTF